MPQISIQEFERLPLRVHDLLSDVALHDVWAVDLRRTRPGITLIEFLQASGAPACRTSPVVGALLRTRLFVGRLLGLDREPPAASRKTFVTRLTTTDQSESLAVGTREGLFRVVYRFANEQLLEVMNRTVHAAVLNALVENSDTYRFYVGIYVRRVSRFTPIYMALIDPLRKLVVYPSLLRTIRTNWNRTFAPPDH